MNDIAKIFGKTQSDTFLGFSRGDLDNVKPGIAVMGVPLATPYPETGNYAAEAPNAIRAALATYASARDHYDFDVCGPLLGASIEGQPGVEAVDYGDVKVDMNDFTANRSAITVAVRAIRNAGAIPILIGGDDSIPIPVLEAFNDLSSLYVLQFDAHIDWRDCVGNEKLGLSSNMRRASEMDHVAGITQVGARGIGSARPQDLEDARTWGVHFFPMPVIDDFGIESVIESLPAGADLFINLDIDSLDPSEMPAVIGPSPGGLRFSQVRSIISKISARCRIVGFALTEFTPEKDTNGLAALTAGRLVCNVIGHVARQAQTQ